MGTKNGAGRGRGSAAALVVTLVLTGCGFQPAYGPGGAGAALQGATEITAPDTVDGYLLAVRLQDRLGATGANRWSLSVVEEIVETAAAVSADGVTRRRSLSGSAEWSLADAATGLTVASGQVRAFAGYGTGGNTVALRAAEIDARGRLAVQLADRVVTALVALDLEGADAAQGP